MKKPNLFIVGQPKSGTSALYVMLQEHPDICMCDEKEPSIFARDFLEESVMYHGKNIFCHCTTIEEYLKLFNCRDEKIVGEGSTHYLYSKVAAKEIHDFNPQAKIIIMLREPVDFMHALHSQQVAEMREDVEDFEEALKLEEPRKRGEHLPKTNRCPSYHFYKTRTDYLTHIKRFLQHFPKEQILVIIFEDFKKDNLQYLKRIAAFLGIDANYVPGAKVVNKNKTVRFKPVYRIFQSQGLKTFFRNSLKAKTYFKIKGFIDRIFFRTEKRKPISPELYSRLRDELRPMVIQLNAFLHQEKFMDIDIVKLWGYGK